MRIMHIITFILWFICGSSDAYYYDRIMLNSKDVLCPLCLIIIKSFFVCKIINIHLYFKILIHIIIKVFDIICMVMFVHILLYILLSYYYYVDHNLYHYDDA